MHNCIFSIIISNNSKMSYCKKSVTELLKKDENEVKRKRYLTAFCSRSIKALNRFRSIIISHFHEDNVK